MRTSKWLILSFVSGLLIACGPTSSELATSDAPTLECDYSMRDTYNDLIPIQTVKAEKSTLVGNLFDFVSICKSDNEFPLLIKDSKIKTHQVTFGLEGVFPLKEIIIQGYSQGEIQAVEKVSIDLSMDGYLFTRFLSNQILQGTTTIALNDEMARAVRINFEASEGVTMGLQLVQFRLGQGLLVREAKEWSEAFYRTEGWSGADGIFSFNLNGSDDLGANQESTAFVFSDTFVGPVNPTTHVRVNNVMINNSIGYYNGNPNIREGLTFDYATNTNGRAQSPFLPDSYVGYQANHLFDSYGLSSYLDPQATLNQLGEGVSWLSDSDDNIFLDLDLFGPQDVGNLTIWNYNAEPSYGVKKIKILESVDQLQWTEVGTYEIAMASGSATEPKSSTIALDRSAIQYLRLEIIESYSSEKVGLGKLLLQDLQGEPLFAQIQASHQIPDVINNERTGRLWLQDGLVLNNSLYLFPLLIKDAPGLFEVDRVGLIKTPIINNKIEFSQAEYMTTPLQSRPPGGGTLYFGAGVMNHIAEDGYIYVYGYKDYRGRNLIVARVLPQEFENFNAWTYYNGVTWTSRINDSAPLIQGVSPELSVTYLKEGPFAGKYLLVAMENTVSGYVAYSLGESPVGPFPPLKRIYRALELNQINKSTTYNAKLHPHLSTPGKWLVSYNVNSSDLSAFRDARIYHPRFIYVIEVKELQED